MNNKFHYSLVGAFILVFVFLAVLMGFWLFTQGQTRSYNTYVTYAVGGVDGLAVKSPVQYNGVLVGYVSDIHLSKDNPSLVELKLKIDKAVPVLESTRATLVPQGITGVMYVGLEAGKPPIMKPLRAKPGQLYPVITYKEPLMAQLSEVVPRIADNIKTMSSSAGQLLTDQNIEAFSKLLNNMALISQTLVNNTEEINKSLAQLSGTLASINQAGHSMDQAGQSMAQAGVQISKTLQNSQMLINTVSSQLFPGLYQTMQQLQQTSTHMQRFSAEVAENPAILIRGSQRSEGEGW